MKIAILCIFFVAPTWALPKVQNPLSFKRYVDPTGSTLPLDLALRIINGRPVEPHSIPYQVYLVFVSENISVWTCGGSLISPKHVLTSANCLYAASIAVVSLGVHSTQNLEASQVVLITQTFISYEGYKPESIFDDIGIIVLDEEVEFNEYIGIVALPSRNTTTDFAGQNARISGWGVINDDKDIAYDLREANVTIISNDECRKVYSVLLDSHMCSIGKEGQTFCDGDNGGPLVVDNTQVGIISFTATGCSSDYPAGYTRITNYLDWIEENTGLKF